MSFWATVEAMTRSVALGTLVLLAAVVVAIVALFYR
jgi:hypothetical protein